MDELIINKKDSLRAHHKVTYFSVTFIFWVFILYLWQPLISLIAWYFGFQLFYEHMIELGGYQAFIDSLKLDFQIIAASCITLIVWGKVNQWRFRGKCRRTGGRKVRQDEVAEYFKVEPSSLHEMMKLKNITLQISDDKVITSPNIKDLSQ